jgi:ornithine cyclodeaminase/alanine dehydrogenase-like protein (mu-crystallin family)
MSDPGVSVAGYVAGLDSLAMKIGPSFFDNSKIGLPSYVCDLTGMGVQDTASATLARQRAAAKAAGTNMQS